MSTPQKRETPLAGGAVAKQNTLAEIVAHESDENKALSTIVAKFALLGHAVHKLSDGGFVVVRWGMSRCCPDAAALGAFLAQIGGRL